MMVKPLTVIAYLYDDHITTEDSDAARELYNQSRYGAMKGSVVELSFIEAMYLVEKKKISLCSPSGKEFSYTTCLKKAKKYEHHFFERYAVFKDIRDRGYIIKTALKFGADFRVYDRGVKPGEDHAKWVVYPVSEGTTMTWHEFSAKNRVAHSTKKRLLIAVVDAEFDVTYYEVRWLRP